MRVRAHAESKEEERVRCGGGKECAWVGGHLCCTSLHPRPAPCCLAVGCLRSLAQAGRGAADVARWCVLCIECVLGVCALASVGICADVESFTSSTLLSSPFPPSLFLPSPPSPSPSFLSR
jgi:hypothetical protein